MLIGTIRTFVALALACGALSACETSSSPDEYSDPAVPIRVSMGDQPVLRLASNPSTGFSWSLGASLDESIVRLEGSRYVADRRVMPGSGGTELWTFRTVGRGSTAIVMRYARPWEDEGATVSEFQLEVR
jgi:inhibitor of cysteine peptidase